MSQPNSKKSEIPTFTNDLARVEAERDALRLELVQVRAELDRRARNENRNCINYAPCSRHDGRMEDVG